MPLTLSRTTTTRCRRCGAETAGASEWFERRLDLGVAEEADSLLVRLCGPCSADLGDDAHRFEYLRLAALA